MSLPCLLFLQPLHVCLSKSQVFFFFFAPLSRWLFVLNCGEFCVFLCNWLLQLDEWCALPGRHPPSSPPLREVLFPLMHLLQSVLSASIADHINFANHWWLIIHTQTEQSTNSHLRVTAYVYTCGAAEWLSHLSISFFFFFTLSLYCLSLTHTLT